MKTYLLIVFYLLSLSSLTSQTMVWNGGGGNLYQNGNIFGLNKGASFLYQNVSNAVSSKMKYGVDASIESRFGLSSLNTFSLGGFLKIDKNSIASLSFVRFGEIGLLEQRLNLSYGRKLFSKLDASLGFNLLQLNLEEFGTSTNLTFDIGLTSQVSDKVVLGVLASNPAALGQTDNLKSPIRLATAIRYAPSKKVNATLELEKIWDRNIALKLATNYDITSNLSIGVGGDITRGSILVGLSYSFSNIALAGSYGMHQRLGQSPALSFGYIKFENK